MIGLPVYSYQDRPNGKGTAASFRPAGTRGSTGTAGDGACQEELRNPLAAPTEGTDSGASTVLFDFVLNMRIVCGNLGRLAPMSRCAFLRVVVVGDEHGG